MIVKTMKGAFDAPRRSYAVALEDYEEEMISPNQRRTLTNLIYEKIGDDRNERERWLNQLDDMTKVDAEDAIFDFLSAIWR
jgi:hypothetical protein